MFDADIVSKLPILFKFEADIVSIEFNLAEVEDVNDSKLFTLPSFEELIVSILFSLAIVEAVNVFVAFISIPATEPVNEPVSDAVAPSTTIVVPLSCAENIFIR
jgi:hypothetical protein